MEGDSPAQSALTSRPRKRPRTESFDADADATLIEEPASVKVVRDHVYYNPSGDCKIRVDDTLFCVHRFLLERDSSTFQTMFQLPQGVSQPQGSTDEDPILLVGDTVAQFRALCWALYALPDEIVKESTAKDSIEKLTEVATISHKYQLAAFQSWSMGSIRQHCQSMRSSESDGRFHPYLNICLPRLLPLFLRLSVLYGEDALLSRVVTAWVSRLGTTSPSSPCYLPVSAFSTALQSGEENHLREFLGRLYYVRLQVAHSTSSHSVPLIEPPFQELEPRHLQRILRGSYLLSTTWQNIISSIPELSRDSKCYQHYTCVPEWNKLWAEASTKGGAADVHCKLDWVSAHLHSGLDGSAKIAPSCADKGKGIVENLIKQMKQVLPGYFLGPP
ncbi:hypothetical protein B0H14DRAFT_1142428 [Mycena olivaceomarginata]|nr:hypothetical protein B0H14DRAFT_1142428 [Mycena olivaceomarginata]